jgi:hypothetical protein
VSLVLPFRRLTLDSRNIKEKGNQYEQKLHDTPGYQAKVWDCSMQHFLSIQNSFQSLFTETRIGGINMVTGRQVTP